MLRAILTYRGHVRVHSGLDMIIDVEVDSAHREYWEGQEQVTMSIGTWIRPEVQGAADVANSPSTALTRLGGFVLNVQTQPPSGESRSLSWQYCADSPSMQMAEQLLRSRMSEAYLEIHSRCGVRAQRARFRNYFR